MPKLSEVEFIKEIQKRECLYNFNLQEYNFRPGVDRAWAEVAEKANMTPTECKEKWRNMRNAFVRTMRLMPLRSIKPYYLSPHLQFIVPFIKHCPIDLDESQKTNTDSCQIADENKARAETILIKPECAIDVEDNQLESVSLDVHTNILSEENSRHTGLNNRVHRKRKRPKSPNNLSKHNQKQPAASTSISNYCRRLNNSSMRYFLLSLLPDFESMTNEQIRSFKVRVMMLIDDIKRKSAKE